MKTFYTIGEVEKITGISKDRLRNYDKKEILKPVHEEHNQYRQYSEQDIIDILGIEHFRGMDLGLKEIKAIREQGSVEYLYEMLQNKKAGVQEELERLQNILKLLTSTELACERILKELNQYSIRKMPCFRVLGELSQSNSFDEYEQMREWKKETIPILKSVMRKITYTEKCIQTNQVLIIEDDCKEENQQIYEKCLYMIAEEKVNGEDLKEELFPKTMQYIQEHHYEPQGVVFIKPLLISCPFQQLTTYLEIYVPLK